MSLEKYEGLILALLNDGLTYKNIADHLVWDFGPQMGFCERSVRRFCADRNITKKEPAVSDVHLELEVAKAINKTGSTFGRKMMTGYLSSKGLHVAEVRIGAMLKDIQQPYHCARALGARNLNPTPYHAEYVGHKLHLDQNEKLAMFGVTHIMAVDGFSKKIMAHSTMPIKNNLKIYEEVYRSAVISHGLWDQIRVDYGKEFYLSLFIREMLAGHRHNLQRPPYVQTPSTRNHIVERMWVEVNNRVNFPLKRALVQMVDQEELDMEDSTVKYCASNITCQMADLGLRRLVDAWNAHRIPGKGTPNDLARHGCPAQIPESLLPVAGTAADLYEQELGGALTRSCMFGIDPFPSEDQKAMAENQFCSHFPDLALLYENVVNGNYRPYQNALKYLIDISRLYA